MAGRNDLNLSATAASVFSGSRKSGSVEASGTFMAAISARSQSIGWSWKWLLIDAGIGDEEALRSEPKPDALGDAGKFCGERRPRGAVENPDRAEFAAPQQRGQPEQIDAAPQLGAGMLEIHRLGDRRLGGKELLGVARRRRQKRHAAARRDAGDGADEGQVPDDIADAGLDLDHGAACRLWCHVACRAKGCDMRL